MTIRYAKRTGVVGLALAGLVLAGVGPAQALPEMAFASGKVGTVHATYNNAPVNVSGLAACSTEGPAHGVNPRYAVTGFLEFGPGRSTCSRNVTTGVARADVSGDLFRLDALRPYGGPLIRLTNFSVTCQTTANGTTASFHIGSLLGISVPATLPPNYVVTIPGKPAGTPPMATVTFNESVQPDPPDGSLTVNIMRIRLYPAGAQHGISGEIVVGTVGCAPF
jgi:hypothetical protein